MGDAQTIVKDVLGDLAQVLEHNAPELVLSVASMPNMVKALEGCGLQLVGLELQRLHGLVGALCGQQDTPNQHVWNR